MKKKFIVAKCEQSKVQDGIFYFKVQTYVETVFGRQVAESYSVKGTNPLKVGDEIEVDMNLYDVVEHTNPMVDERSGVVVNRITRWLHIKRA